MGIESSHAQPSQQEGCNPEAVWPWKVREMAPMGLESSENAHRPSVEMQVCTAASRSIHMDMRIPLS